VNRIDLRGLRGDLPIGAMAAFGCLRLCERTEGFQGSKLSWNTTSGVPHAILWTPEPRTPEALVEALAGDLKIRRERPELTWRDQIKTAMPADFRLWGERAAQAASAEDRDGADWFAAFGTELVLDREGRIEPTPFDMSVARQRFLADAQRLASGLTEERGKGKTPAASYAEALFGPWRYEDDQHSLGWDPSTMKLGAFTHKAPTAMANAGVRAAVWLAFESLPLFPCFFSNGLQTRGFERNGREVALVWPIWESPIGGAALRILLGIVTRADESDAREEMKARGIAAVYRSQRFKPNKYLASFRTPELVFSEYSSPAAV